MGRVTHPRRTAQAWYRHRGDQRQLVSIDFFTLLTIRFQVLHVSLVLAHDRRRILHCGVTAHPTAEWTAQQPREAFPWDTAPRYLLRDRDDIFGDEFTNDPLVVFNEASLRGRLLNYLSYSQRSGTRLSLAKDAPESRPVEPPELGNVVAIPEVGGLHHRYERRVA